MGILGTFLRRRGRDKIRAARAKGSRAEARALRAAQRIDAWWFVSARPATTEEDHKGVDLVIATRDVGGIRLQIKSSQKRADAFIERGKAMQARWRIHVLVVPPSDDDNSLFGRVLGTLIRAREEALAAGLLADDPRLAQPAI